MNYKDQDTFKNPCDKCGQDLDWLKESDGLHKKNKEHVRMVKEHCERHEFMYSPDKCKPIWCKKCGYLEIYQVIL